MVFPGIPRAADRRNLITFLRASSEGTAPTPPGGMMAMQIRSLKNVSPDERVTRVTYCADAYRVTTASGKTRMFWEFNLRFKTDSSAEGPRPGQPVLIPASMRGDRAFLVFAAPQEISTAIHASCDK